MSNQPSTEHYRCKKILTTVWARFPDLIKLKGSDYFSNLIVNFFISKPSKNSSLFFQLKTQMQREALLAKEAKYEHGLKKGEYDYDELVNAFKDNNNASKSENRVGAYQLS